MLSSFLKRLFKDDTEGITGKDEHDVIKSVTNGLTAEENILSGDSIIDTNKLHDSLTNNLEAEAFKGFSRYLFCSESHQGMVRKNNQDSTFTGEFKYSISNRIVSGGIAIVADGMGGLSKGEVASATAITSVSTYLYARLSEYLQNSITNGLPHSQVILGHINDAMKNANRIIWEKGNAMGESIGTTLTCAFILGNVAYFGHAGDSRAYIIDTENKLMEKVTRDHSLVARLIEMGHISESEARSHPRRNEIYRMLGLREHIEVDTYYRIINKNTIVLIMSDGLWEFVDDKEIFNSILNKGEQSAAVKLLIDHANKNGGHDNISLITIRPIE